MTLIKSISGIRGTIGGHAGEGLNPLDIVKFTSAYATLIRKTTSVKSNKIVVGRDARISGEMVKNVVCGTLMGMGFDVVNIGLASTPTTELAVTMEGACGGIILTASHNPKQWNALKLLNEHGEFLNKEEGNEVLRIAEAEAFEFADVDHLGKYTEDNSYNQKHIDSVLALDLVDKRLVTDQIVLTIGYDIKNLEQGTKKNVGEITTDWYGRKLPKHAHGTANLKQHTSSSRLMTQAGVKLYHEIVNPDLLIRRITMAANHVISEKEVQEEQQYEQMNLFTDFGIAKKEKEEKNEKLEREKKMQKAMLDIKKKYGKNAILKGMNLQEDGTAMERNRQIGGHKA